MFGARPYLLDEIQGGRGIFGVNHRDKQGFAAAVKAEWQRAVATGDIAREQVERGGSGVNPGDVDDVVLVELAKCAGEVYIANTA